MKQSLHKPLFYVLIGCIALAVCTLVLTAHAAKPRQRGVSGSSDSAMQKLESILRLDDKDMLPDYYGGAYHESNGSITVYLTDMTVKEELVAALGEYAEMVEFKKGELSLKQMIGYVHLISDELSASGIHVNGGGTNEKEQRIVIMIEPSAVETARCFVEDHYPVIPVEILGMSEVDHLMAPFKIDD